VTPEPEAIVIVTGTVVARPENLNEVLAASLEHVRRSRAEPGCISHAVLQDIEDENRLVFFERWADRTFLDDHFRVPASADFVRAVTGLAAEPPSMVISQASRSG
jgi:quinol monooxygenase YgiN